MKKLPLSINTELCIKSIEHKPAAAKCRILGARPGDFIIIDTPVLRFSDRLTGKLTGSIQCTFIHEGEAFDFISTIQKHLDDGFSLIDYPDKFERRSLRNYRRIRVNIETHLLFEEERKTLRGIMTDISNGGCKLIIPSFCPTGTGVSCILSFSLPDKTNVKNLKGITRNVRLFKLKKRTELGVSFTEPPSELAKVASFCGFCMFFDV